MNAQASRPEAAVRMVATKLSKKTCHRPQTRTHQRPVQGKLESHERRDTGRRPGHPSGETVPETGEAQRNLDAILSELGHKAADGSVAAAAGYATKKILDKLGNRHPNDKEPPKQDSPPEGAPTS